MSTALSHLANELIVAATETANQSDVHTRDSFPLALMNETLFPPQAVLPLEDGGFIFFIYLFLFGESIRARATPPLLQHIAHSVLLPIRIIFSCLFSLRLA